MRVLINFSTTSRYHESPVERARRSRKIGWSAPADRKTTRLNSSHSQIPYAAFCLNKKMVGDPSSQLGNLCLIECTIPLGFSHGRVDPASSGLCEARDHNDNDPALIPDGPSFITIN